MDELKLLLQFPAYGGIIILWMWNRSQKIQIDTMQERLDRMQDRQNELFNRALKKTDLKDTDH